MTRQGGDTRFGQPRANRTGNPSTAVAQREFYRWVECRATEDELKAYVNDKGKPLIRRRFIDVFLRADSVRDFCEITNQTHGAPKQIVEQTNLTDVRIILEDSESEDE